MLTLLYGLLSLTIVLLPVLWFYRMDKHHLRREQDLLLQKLHQEAQEKNLSFSSQEVLRGVVFGLDAIKRQILVVEKIGEGKYHSTLVPLDEVRKCITWQVYSKPNAENERAEKRDSLPTRITLSLELEGRNAFHLVLYSVHTHTVRELPALEKKARYWEAILSKLVVPAQWRA